MDITPDAIVFWEWGFVKLNLTIVFTWAVMFILVAGSAAVTRRLSTETELSRWQNLLEVIVVAVRDQVRGVSSEAPDRYLPFIGTLFLFIALSNLLAIVPGFNPPTGSLSTTTALALCVLAATPIYGIGETGVKGYLAHYVRPTVFMLPFNLMGEVSRTIALAVRLFGNVMSGTMIAGILISIAPLFFPIVMRVLGLITGMIQAYIFAILAIVYIASASRAHREREQSGEGAEAG